MLDLIGSCMLGFYCILTDPCNQPAYMDLTSRLKACYCHHISDYFYLDLVDIQ